MRWFCNGSLSLIICINKFEKIDGFSYRTRAMVLKTKWLNAFSLRVRKRRKHTRTKFCLSRFVLSFGKNFAAVSFIPSSRTSAQTHTRTKFCLSRFVLSFVQSRNGKWRTLLIFSIPSRKQGRRFKKWDYIWIYRQGWHLPIENHTKNMQLIFVYNVYFCKQMHIIFKRFKT